MVRRLCLPIALSLALTGCLDLPSATNSQTPAGTTVPSGPHQIVRGQIVPPAALDDKAGWLVIPTDLDGRYVRTEDGRSLAISSDASGSFALELNVATDSVLTFTALLRGDRGLSALYLPSDPGTVSLSVASSLAAQLVQQWHAAGKPVKSLTRSGLEALTSQTDALLAQGVLPDLDLSMGAAQLNANRYLGAIAHADPALGQGWAAALGEDLPVLSTLAGNFAAGTSGLAGEQAAREVSLRTPEGVTVANGTVYVALPEMHQIVGIQDGRLTPVLGAAVTDPTELDALASDAATPLDSTIPKPAYLAVDAFGNVFFSSETDPRLFLAYRHARPGGFFGDAEVVPGKIYPIGELYDPTDDAASKFADGALAQARFDVESSVLLVDDALMIADTYNNRIRRLDLNTGMVSTVAGGPHEPDETKHNFNGHEQAEATDAWLSRPAAMAARTANGQQELFFLDRGNDLIRVLRSTDGFAHASLATMGELAATPPAAPAGGQSSQNLGKPSGLALDAEARTLYFTDGARHQVGAMDLSTHQVVAVAGTGTVVRDGLAVWTQLGLPAGLAFVGPDLVIADNNTHTVRLLKRFKAP